MGGGRGSDYQIASRDQVSDLKQKENYCKILTYLFTHTTFATTSLG